MKHPRIIIAGDFNLPDWDWENMILKKPTSYPSLHKQFLNTIRDMGMEQMIKEPTRDDNILDLVVTNMPQLIPRTELIPGLGDHDKVYFEMNIKLSHNRQKPRPVPIYKKANWDKMKEDMIKTDGDIQELVKDPETTTDKLYTTFEESLKKSIKENIPVKMLTKKVEHPWITYEIKKLMRKRDRTYRKWKKNKTEEKEKQLKSIKKEIQTKVRRAHWDYVNGLTIRKEGDEHEYEKTKRFYTYMKHQKNSSTGVAPLKDQGKLVLDPEKKAELLNQTFQKAFSSGTSYTDEEIVDKCKMPMDNEKYKSMPELIITRPGVEKILEKLNPSKAPGPDGLSPRILRALSKEIAPILTTIYRHSLISGKVPKQWKKANVTPIYKKGEHYQPSNYRPVSLTSVPCKIMEHILVSNIMTHLEDNNILKDNQHGFRKKRSCETQLLELTNHLTSSLEKGIQTDLIVLDFAKAFDKVNHSLLVYKLRHYGIRGAVKNWIEDFLSQREQAVVVDGAQSSSIPVASGVPQGSVLGPCLFLMYINDLPEAVDSTSRLFADDTGVHRDILEESDGIILQQDLDALNTWEERWDMSFHPVKCLVLRHTRSKKPIETIYKLHGQVLSIVPSTVYLGLTIQDDGEWKKHIDNIESKGNQLLGFLRRNMRIDNKQAKQEAYKMLIRQPIEYGAVIWDPYHKTDIEKLERIQRRAARFVQGDFKQTSSVTAMINSLRWPSLEERRQELRINYLIKIITSKVAVKKDLLVPATSRPRRTHNCQLKLISSSKDYRKNSFFPRTIRDWNALPTDSIPKDVLSFFGKSH